MELQSGEFERSLLELVHSIIPEMISLLRTNKVVNAEDLIITELNTYIEAQGPKKKSQDWQKTLTKVTSLLM